MLLSIVGIVYEILFIVIDGFVDYGWYWVLVYCWDVLVFEGWVVDVVGIVYGML